MAPFSRLFERPAIPPLISGGLMLSYRCTNTCRHCLYRCSPRQPDEWMTLDMAERAMAALRGERRLQGIHIAGGEATIRMGLVRDVVRLACEAGIPIDYLETNAFWCRDYEQTRRQMQELFDAGLRSMLISVSLFHNEFIPFRNTRTAIQAATDVFGSAGVTLYLAHLVDVLAQLPGDGTHSLDTSCAALDMGTDDPRVASIYGVIPNGRACSALRGCFQARPAGCFAGETCHRQITSTTHFHIDHDGRLFTGLCAGIRTATIDDLHPEITEGTHPVFTTLCGSGPHGLMVRASAETGFEPNPDGYISKCDLCMDIRACLWRTGRYPELQPAAFYEEGEWDRA